MAGLTATGITIKDVDEVLADMVANQIANIDADLNTESDSVLGQLNGIYAAALAELWELLEEIYQSAYPDTASGQSLSYVSALTGAIRQEATKAELNVILIGTVDAVIPAGTQCYPDGDPDSLFQTTAPATILEQGATDYVEVTVQAVTEGSQTAGAYLVALDVLVIATPAAGLDAIWVSGSDPFAAGLDEETDAELRLRREQTLALAGSTTVEAIRADMLSVTGVDSCTVFENPSSVVDSNGVPPYAIEVLVYSEAAPAYTAEDVAAQIFASKPAGTETYGGEGPETVVDSTGNSHDIYYSEPEPVRTYVELELLVANDGTYVGDSDVSDAVAAWATLDLAVGNDVYASDVISVAAGLTGVLAVEITTVGVDDVTPTVSSSLIIAARELATIATEDVTVSSVVLP